jgi:hypothetical protein
MPGSEASAPQSESHETLQQYGSNTQRQSTQAGWLQVGTPVAPQQSLPPKPPGTSSQ